MLIQFTDFDSIRSVLGVSDDELSDATLILPLYELQLKSELNKLNATLLADYLTVSAQTIPPTALESSFLDSVRLFCTYSVATQAAKSMPMFAPRVLTDGKASFTRFSEAYKDVIESLKPLLMGAKQGVRKGYADWLGVPYSAPATTFGTLWVSVPYDTRVTDSLVVRN